VRGDLISGKAMDNRIGIVTLLELARALQNEQPHAGVTLVGTVQEEYSVRGGVTAARSVRPDFALCLDIAIATDTPGMKQFGDVTLGGGPALTRFTRANLNGIIPNPKLVQFVKDTARAQGIPLQNSVLQGGLTDGSYMQYEGDGIPTLDLSFATRYTHTPVETCSLTDIRQLHQLALAALHGAPKGFDLSRG
jgi:putative aminopeptidase FrvX